MQRTRTIGQHLRRLTVRSTDSRRQDGEIDTFDVAVKVTDLDELGVVTMEVSDHDGDGSVGHVRH